MKFTSQTYVIENIKAIFLNVRINKKKKEMLDTNNRDQTTSSFFI